MRIGAVLLTMTVGLGVSACIAPSGFETVGRTGVTSVDGELAIVWDSCGEDEVRSVELHQDREGLADDEENPRVGEWELGDRDREQKLLVLGATDDPPQLDPARGYVAQAVPAGDVENLPGVHFTPARVAALGPDEVLVGAVDGSVVGTWDDLADC